MQLTAPPAPAALSPRPLSITTSDPMPCFGPPPTPFVPCRSSPTPRHVPGTFDFGGELRACPCNGRERGKPAASSALSATRALSASALAAAPRTQAVSAMPFTLGPPPLPHPSPTHPHTPARPCMPCVPPGIKLLEFMRDHVLLYTDDPDKEIRQSAVLAACRVLERHAVAHQQAVATAQSQGARAAAAAGPGAACRDRGMRRRKPCVPSVCQPVSAPGAPLGPQAVFTLIAMRCHVGPLLSVGGPRLPPV